MGKIIRGYTGTWGEVDEEPVEEVKREEPVGSGDSVLDRMGGTFQGMNGRALLNYFLRRFEGTQGYGLPSATGGARERKIFEGFVARYKDDAGPMVQLLFDKHGGVWERNVVSPKMFAKSYDYFQEGLYHELQRRRKLDETTSGTFMTMAEFVKMFKK